MDGQEGLVHIGVDLRFLGIDYPNVYAPRIFCFALSRRVGDEHQLGEWVRHDTAHILAVVVCTDASRHGQTRQLVTAHEYARLYLRDALGQNNRFERLTFIESK